MKISDYKIWVRFAKLSEKSGNYKLADSVANNLIKLAQNQQFAPGTELQPGQTYEVPTNDNSIFDKVATTGVPDYANVGGEKVLVTHGALNGDGDSMWLISESGASQFFNNNPDFKTSGQIGENDTKAGIKANFESGKNRLWLSKEGMKKYAGSKWVGCYDLIGGKGFGAYGGSKGPIEVVTQTGPEGQKTFVQTPQ